MSRFLGYVIPELKTGGTEKQVVLLASGLRRRGFDAQILCLFQKGPLAALAEEKKVPVSSLELPYGWNFKTFRSLYSWVKSARPAILHSFLFGFDFFAACPARLAGVRAVFSSRRGRALSHWSKDKHRKIEKLGNGFVNRIVCNSREGARWVLENEKVSPAKVVVIPNGIEPELFGNFQPDPALRREFGIPEKAPLVGTVANFSPEKGYEILLEAAELVLQARPDTWFLFVGGGPLIEVMKARARALERGRQIIFAGTREDTARILASLDLFVLASFLEGCPNALLEAMAMGKPVIACETGGIPELVESGKDGLLVSPRNFAQLAEAILTLLANPAKGRAFGEAARTKVRENFSLERMLDQYERLYAPFLQK